jgi:lysozyme family protein
MSEFRYALPIIFEHEGGDAFTNDPVDPGGATKWGVSLRYLISRGDLDRDGLPDGDIDGDGDIDIGDVRLVTREKASWLYETGFWLPNRLTEVASQWVATKMLDTAVNVGSLQAWRLAQRALVRCGQHVTVDGKVGPQTLGALNSVREGMFLPQLSGQQRAYYELLITKKPPLAKYRRGWTRRAAWPYRDEEALWRLT